ncbi:hypothetical protein [Poseidonocella sp. HB161398]|uniref:hypothetical protein n=1 Tax=Poseidonocella sp. HB161398 TaxID=2320855 RepID=UPI001108A140|nr:hypothetical protein [Poseidonocella sp. HB161398]
MTLILNSQRHRDTHALRSSITPEQLADAMSALDLASIPPHKRPAAIREHLARIMATTILDRHALTRVVLDGPPRDI